VINPGSTSTKVAVYRGATCVENRALAHPRRRLARLGRIADQADLRREAVRAYLAEQGYAPEHFAAVSARGGLTKPIPGGVYRVNTRMLRDLACGRWGEHACCLGAPLAAELAAAAGCPAFVVDPPVVDEMWDVARVSGHPAMPRRSLFHALSQRAAARRAARDLGIRYNRANFIVVHAGGGISVGAHRRGRVLDVNNALDGDGPFSPERTGGLPTGDLVQHCFSGRYNEQEVMDLITRHGGLVAHLGTNDCVAIEERIGRGDRKAEGVYEALGYQIAKAIGSAAATLSGRVKAVVLTGGLSASKMLVRIIKKYAGFVAPMMVYPQIGEMDALAAGADDALAGRRRIREYA